MQEVRHGAERQGQTRVETEVPKLRVRGDVAERRALRVVYVQLSSFLRKVKYEALGPTSLFLLLSCWCCENAMKCSYSAK